jgi:hypothetical protein
MPHFHFELMIGQRPDRCQLSVLLSDSAIFQAAPFLFTAFSFYFTYLDMPEAHEACHGADADTLSFFHCLSFIFHFRHIL